MTFFGGRVFVNVIKMRSYWVQVGSESNDRCPYEERNNWSQEHRDTQGDGGNSHVTTEADCSEAPVNQRMPTIAGNHRKLGRCEEGFFLGAFKGNMTF